jgi:2-methylisocitrate lyase-like PEP mutase family enzyme
MPGGATAMTRGLPDTVPLSLDEILHNLRSITAATSLPVVADADTGFGNAVNIFRTVHEYQRVGAAGLHIEDQESPKRCRYLDGKRVISAEEHASRIRAACEARKDPSIVIIAHTDALQVHGWDEAARRTKIYHEAGADLPFVDGVRALDVSDYVDRLVRAEIYASSTAEISALRRRCGLASKRRRSTPATGQSTRASRGCVRRV